MIKDVHNKEDVLPIEQDDNVTSLESQSLEQLVEEALNFISKTTNESQEEEKILSQKFKESPEIQNIISESGAQIAEASEIANEQINKMKNNTELSELELRPLTNETREEYLCRLSQTIRQKKLNVSGHISLDLMKGFQEWESFSEESLRIIFGNLKNIPIYNYFDEVKNTINIELLKQKIKSDGQKLANKNEKGFDKTNRARTFFHHPELNKGRGINSDKAANYSASMFMVPRIRIKEQLEYLKEYINDKNIYLLGGGYSCLDLLNLNNLKPSKIINIDPFVNEEKLNQLTKNSKTEYKLLKEDAAGDNLLEKIKRNNLPRADEIWASFSVPMYLDNPVQIKKLFDNISLLLNRGGKCRIYPISIEDNSEENRNALIESIKNLTITKKFNIYISDVDSQRPQLIIEKLEE